MSVEIVGFYKFLPLTEADVTRVEQELNETAQKFTARGLGILGPEGLNGTFSVPTEYADEFKATFYKILNTDQLPLKISHADRHPFRDFRIKIRPEIVTLGRTDLVPSGSHNHVSPQEWDRLMREENPIVIDTRNSYEYEVGHFRGSIDPKITEFSEFPQWLRASDLPKNKKILIYCTGGIRCEKAILEMQEQGFEHVYQLDGGILNYLKEFPEGQWEGECFIFDHRVALDNHLCPTQIYQLCPHCGLPGKEEILCVQCDAPKTVCLHCLKKSIEYKTCSKDCAHHKRIGSKPRRKITTPLDPYTASRQ